MLKTPLKTLVDILISHFTKERLVTLILTADEKLLIFMLEHENANDYKNAFFKIIANTLVFNEKALLECLEIKELEKSFTRFKNKIGLFSQGGLIKSSELVVLNFPFKDNVLLGNAKDNSTKSKELFYHEILHKKEIDTLLSKKVLCRFEMHGEGDLESALQDKNTNYLIKGNNLIALHSLKKKFAKQVKCIYIDPPYNTGNDSFNYNDNFNHSSWLVFMKNRLEAAREFLSDDGVIFVQCDDNEQAYLKVLMDEIFGKENFVSCITHIVKPEGRMYGQVAKTHEYILVYAKNINNLIFNEIEKEGHAFSYADEKGGFDLQGLENRNFRAFNGLNIPSLRYGLFIDENQKDSNGFMPVFGEYRDGLTEVFPDSRNGFDLVWRWGKEKALKENHSLVGVFKDRLRVFQKVRSNTTRAKSIFWDKSMITQKGTEEVKQIFKTQIFDFPKPEALLKRILEISTQENDLVLDFFAGSGTTCAVAHKMKRRYIGIEQMDYIKTITKERLKKVIEGEQGGISKKCDFKGGGSFVYAELKEVNLEIKKQILNAKSADECLKIFNDLNERFLKRADCKTDEIHSEEFHNLDLNEQKRICCNLLDSNEDYLNLGDIDEDAWEIDKITKKYNEIFYS
ncbi:site-specific DNA-methyltransferase [Helicobacter pylori]|uniref:site-specific DNA-methyltransferase n=1 Tax=Helicobacter pylori TaxID=210 RepID=UPI0009945707|nr:site-specific DNA-methyltransferase [Helicobacter pylori]OOQ27346.1 site-specific DNA-methyltransferase [Helicobacter pylori]PDX07502.1 methyltransferase [Helicobacter pylori]WQU47624.1 site-specific DNA-methyltransferase [Helicobacter pylori]